MKEEEARSRWWNGRDMRLSRVNYSRYRSIESESVGLGRLNVFIGANAAGKSNLLDGLRLLKEAVVEKDFARAVGWRGGLIHLAWKGEPADDVRLDARFDHDGATFAWEVRLRMEGHGSGQKERRFSVEERLSRDGELLLEARKGRGHWISGNGRSSLELPATGCALAAVAVDASFAGKEVPAFIERWGFFDPSPVLLRRAGPVDDSERLDSEGRNLAARLLASFVQHLQQAAEQVQIVLTTHSPLLLDWLDDPAAVRVVRRAAEGGTTVHAEDNPDAVRKALDESGLGLGELHETRGFGA